MMLTVQGLHSHYGLSHVLQGVEFQVGDAELIALVGRNGVGKTTILKTVAGWVKPSDGSIRLNGEEIGGLAPHLICRRGVGLVPEDRRIFPGLTVEENLKLGLLQAPRRSGKEKKAAIDRAYERFPRLLERRTQLGTTLSGGEQQMLAIARVLVGAPKLLLIDEPTEGLAPIIVNELFDIIAGFRREGIAVVLVEQNVVRTLDIADRVYAVERGQIILEARPDRREERDRILQAIAV